MTSNTNTFNDNRPRKQSKTTNGTNNIDSNVNQAANAEHNTVEMEIEDQPDRLDVESGKMGSSTERMVDQSSDSGGNINDVVNTGSTQFPSRHAASYKKNRELILRAIRKKSLANDSSTAEKDAVDNNCQSDTSDATSSNSNSNDPSTAEEDLIVQAATASDDTSDGNENKNAPERPLQGKSVQDLILKLSSVDRQEGLAVLHQIHKCLHTKTLDGFHKEFIDNGGIATVLGFLNYHMGDENSIKECFRVLYYATTLRGESSIDAMKQIFSCGGVLIWTQAVKHHQQEISISNDSDQKTSSYTALKHLWSAMEHLTNGIRTLKHDGITPGWTLIHQRNVVEAACTTLHRRNMDLTIHRMKNILATLRNVCKDAADAQSVQMILADCNVAESLLRVLKRRSDDLMTHRDFVEDTMFVLKMSIVGMARSSGVNGNKLKKESANLDRGVLFAFCREGMLQFDTVVTIHEYTIFFVEEAFINTNSQVSLLGYGVSSLLAICIESTTLPLHLKNRAGLLLKEILSETYIKGGSKGTAVSSHIGGGARTVNKNGGGDKLVRNKKKKRKKTSKMNATSAVADGKKKQSAKINQKKSPPPPAAAATPPPLPQTQACEYFAMRPTDCRKKRIPYQ